MRRTCFSYTAGSLSLPCRGEREEFFVGNAAPQEEGEARSEFEIADAVSSIRRDVRGIALDAEHELGLEKDPLQGDLNAGIEIAVIAAGLTKLSSVSKSPSLTR